MKLSSGIKVFLSILIVAVFIFGIKAISIYRKAFISNITLENKEYVHVYIPTGASIDNVIHIFDSLGIVNNMKSLMWVIDEKNYANHIKPGRYKIKDGTTNNLLVNTLRSGNQDPVKFVVAGRIHTIHELSELIDKYLEIEAQEIRDLLSNKDCLDSLGYNEQTVIGIFIPNTYELYWNISARDFVARMKKESDAFWSKSRLRKAERMRFTQNEVLTLASIVNEESSKDDELERIAGLYINRLNKGIRLQADPTVKFAVGDFAIKRVLNQHLKVNSPYNTYRNSGLPPGPIGIPSIKAIDAVLNYERHNYLYMCAKEDFSGYHHFAKTLSQHNKNAAKYRRALDKRRIYN